MFSLDYRPQIRPDIVFGPPENTGKETFYYIKDTATQWFYRVREKEYFLLAAMNGQNSLEQINAAYQQRFQHSLSTQSWANLFDLVRKRHLLVDSADSEAIEKLRQRFDESQRVNNQKLFQRRFVLFKPDSFISQITPYLSWLFNPIIVGLSILTIVLTEFFIVMNWTSLLGTLSNGANQVALIALSIGISWLAIVIHEMAHAVACKRFGGTVNEFGLLWRFLFIVPYTKVDDVMLFHNRWHRVYTAVAGIYANLLLISLFVVMWLVTPEESLWHAVAAWQLIIFNGFVLFSLLPFFQLDGYFILMYAFNVTDLSQATHKFWIATLQKKLFGKGEGAEVYQSNARPILFGYGILSLLFYAAMGITFIVSIYRYLSGVLL